MGLLLFEQAPRKYTKTQHFCEVCWSTMIISLGNWQELCTYVPKCVKKQCVFKFVLFKTARRVQQGWFQTEAGFSDISGNTFYLCVPGYIYICIYTCINVYTSIYLCSGLIVCPPWWIQIKCGRGRTILPKTSFHTKNMFQKVSSPFALAGSLVH